MAPIGAKRRGLAQVLLNESWTEVHVDLDQRFVADAAKAVDLPSLDYQDVTGAGLELLAIDVVEAAAFSNELDFVVWMAVGSGTTPGQRSEKERGDGDIALVGPDELVRTALERKVLLTHAIHAAPPFGGCTVVLFRLDSPIGQAPSVTWGRSRRSNLEET
jgi:hypothetical protein